MNIHRKSAKGLTLVEVVVASILVTVIVMAMGTILVQGQNTANRQQVIEHVNTYGHEALKYISEEIRRATEIHVSSLLGMSRIRLVFPNTSGIPGQINSETISADRDQGMMIGRDPLLTVRGSRNAFLFDDQKNIDFRINDFSCELVPASEGISGKLSRNFYDLNLKIEMIIENTMDEEVSKDYQFHRRVFAVSDYISP